MEEIIGLLLALGVLVFRVAKKINDADTPVRPAQPAQPAATRQSQTLEELFPEIQAVSEYVPEEHHVEILEEPEPILEESKNSEKKEKIDPKKLIMYSEIMKRKY